MYYELQFYNWNLICNTIMISSVNDFIDNEQSLCMYQKNILRSFKFPFSFTINHFIWKKINPLAENYFFWEEHIISLEIFKLADNYFLRQGIISVKEILSFARKSFPLTGNHFFSQEIISFHRKLFPFTGNYCLSEEIIFLSPEIISFHRKSFH